VRRRAVRIAALASALFLGSATAGDRGRPAAATASEIESRAGIGHAPHVLVSVEYPFVRAKLRLRDGSRRRVDFRGWFQGRPDAAPESSGALLRVMGGPDEGDTGVITLSAGRWFNRPARRSADNRGRTTLRYADRKARSGGIRSVTVRLQAGGGSISITGGKEAWAYALDRPQSRVSVVLEIGATRWCTEFTGSALAQEGTRRLRGRLLAPAACDCVHVIESTWEAIQTLVFRRHACTFVVCHGTPPGSGDLDLTPTAAYDALVGVPSTADPAYTRVEPGAPTNSMLWRKLAARTVGLEGVPLNPMPIADPPLATNELAAVERWIAAGALEDGVVPGTPALLGFCLPQD
jgi:hypothetical protein